ncbi:MAG: hypothetical protein JEZ09_04725 [Salinivirgaceae bacterium]|nr:hypothetical protein [Salinivirgaceae bacterium]
MNKIKLYILVILSFTFFIISKANAQCCGAGNPVSGFGNVSGLPFKTLLIGSSYKYSYSDQYYSSSDKTDISPDKSYYNFVGFDMAYGITNRLSVRADIGYFINKAKIYNIEGWSSMKGYGLGDAELSMKYAVVKRVLKKFDIIPGIGVKLPVGVFDQVVDDVKLPISLQPSSGSLKYNVNVFVFKGINKHSVSFRAFAEFANRIQSDNFDYKYGNLYIISAYGSFSINKKLNLLSQLRYEYREKSMRENQQNVESSGGQVVFFIPQVNVMPTESFGISVYADIPLYKYMNGTQLSNKFAISIKLSKSINFNKNCEPQKI